MVKGGKGVALEAVWGYDSLTAYDTPVWCYLRRVIRRLTVWRPDDILKVTCEITFGRRIAMKLPTKIRYAVRALVELAEREGPAPVPVKEIAQAQMVSPKYTKQLMNRLQRAGIVRGYPGIHGGYLLARKPRSITVYDIYEAMEVSLDLAPCVGRRTHCSREQECSTGRLWKTLKDALEKTLKNVSIDELAAEERSLRARG